MNDWMRQTLTITRKELRAYFGSLMALIFIGIFLLATLFAFFWYEPFFVRGIADVRPLFAGMPIMLIFLVAALTMRQWSEEQRSGTLEILLTLPVNTAQLVIGKFLAVLALVAVALAMTLFLPITVALLGNLDWGPVFGGYLAALLLAGMYAAIGLFISSRTDNQIVALLSTILLCGVFYFVGTAGVTDFAGNQLGAVLRALGAGSRFESIQRGVIDLRDLGYTMSLAAVFLILNVLSLKSHSWSTGDASLSKRRATSVTAMLLVINLLITNVWLYPLRTLRVDLTQYKEYTLSSTTEDLLRSLQEPLLIRGYFSDKTHPKLAPLVPAVVDMLREYELASGGRVTLEVIDPATDPDAEAEANQVYGIQPSPFRIEERYEASIINSYFDILVQYGDQNATLSFADLIDVSTNRDGTQNVRLRNLEYDLTSTIKKVVSGFQSIDVLLASLGEPVHTSVYITPNTLPERLLSVPATIKTVLDDYASKSGGKFTYTFVDPDDPDSGLSRQTLFDTYGLQPMADSLFAEDTYYMYLSLETQSQAQVIYPSGDLSEADWRAAIESGLQRTTSGFLKVVGLWTPPETPTQDMFGQTIPSLSAWTQVRSVLGQEYELRTLDLSTGNIAPDVDVIVIIGPQGLDDAALYAIDQYLMRGGAVILAAGNSGIMVDPMGGGIAVKPVVDGVESLLEHYGVTVRKGLVLDPQNEPFPIPVSRQVGNVQVQEYQALDYPFFIDIRDDGMSKTNPVVSQLTAVTMNWASPVDVDAAKNAGREVEAVLLSSADAWLQQDDNIQPNFDLFPELGFARFGETGVYTLAVTLQGSFPSYFADKENPLLALAAEADAETAPVNPGAGTIDVSPESARLLVLGSFEFVDDTVLELSAALGGERYLNNLKLVQNAVDWAVEDQDLLSIRSRGTEVRVLQEMDEPEQRFWEWANYAVALIMLIGLGGWSSVQRRNEEPMVLLKADGTPLIEKTKPETDVDVEEEVGV